MLGKKYTAEFKIRMVIEFMDRKKKEPRLSKSDFAFENKISDSTFNDWVLKYQKTGNGLYAEFQSPCQKRKNHLTAETCSATMVK